MDSRNIKKNPNTLKKNDKEETKSSKFIKHGDISVLEYDKTCKTVCYCNSQYWCEKCDGNFDLFE